MSVAALIVAAGRGMRAGEGVPKQYRDVAGQPVLTRALQAFLGHPQIGHVLVVIYPDDRPLYDGAVAFLDSGSGKRLLTPVAGGRTRQESVRSGIEALAESDATLQTVLVHDAARPFVTADLIERAITAGRDGAAVPGIAVTDTIKRIDSKGAVVETPDRGSLRAVQTPQAFPLDLLLTAHRKAAQASVTNFTDDGALVEWAGYPVRIFDGDPGNTKLTRPVDFAEAERRLGAGGMDLVVRTGTGFDVHAFAEGDHVWLGGIRIPHGRGVAAHSDGDVVLHALTDAILGALADGDIGVHFPPSDPQWRGASSDRFLAFAVDRVRARGGVVDHLDVTVLCEAPRLGPHRDAIRERIAAIAGLSLGAVSIKATTTERMGFTGRGEGLAAQAAATIRLPKEC